MTAREIHPVNRWEWEQIILRARFTGLIAGGRNRGGVSGATFTLVALVWASHADADGGRVFPGDGTISVEAEVGIQVVQTVRRALVDLGLIERVRAGSRRQHGGDEYRLTIASDLTERIDVLPPDAVKVHARTANEKRRGERRGSGGSPTPPPDTPVMGDPPEPPQSSDSDHRGGSSGTDESSRGGSCGTDVGGPAARVTNQDQPPTTTNHADQDFFADVTTPRARTPRTGPPRSPGGTPAERPSLSVTTATSGSGPGRSGAPVRFPGTAPDRGPQSATDARTTGMGFCLSCYANGRIAVAVDPVSGDICLAHLRIAAGDPPV